MRGCLSARWLDIQSIIIRIFHSPIGERFRITDSHQLRESHRAISGCARWTPPKYGGGSQSVMLNKGTAFPQFDRVIHTFPRVIHSLGQMGRLGDRLMMARYGCHPDSQAFDKTENKTIIYVRYLPNIGYDLHKIWICLHTHKLVGN